MAAQGAEVVFGDLDHIDSLRRGFKGAYGVYGMTDCECPCLSLWLVLFLVRIRGINGPTDMCDVTVFSCASPEQEVQQGKNIIDAAKECGIQHLVWSTLERTKDKIVVFETKCVRAPS
jgi:hypothetical protein